MAYKVLYRKYRPDSFSKIIGQDSIVDTLKSSIINNNFSHAYIFTGPRGTGKTSAAKVLAKSINCENPIDGEACGKCQSCQNFNTSPDIIEIDAASNNGVDEIREIRTNVTLAPSASKYKVYIIDEVHMLSPGAFNALLKTIEEPPSHAVFILATTEIYKVPITILSRCQRYDFKKINKDAMLTHLKDICEKEKINYENDALEEIYSLSDGCLRDALSLLDQLSKSEKNITLDIVLKNYNIISNKSIESLLNCTFSGDIENLIDLLNKFEDSGMNAQKMIKKIINYLEKTAIDIKLRKEKKYDFSKIKNLIYSLNECYIDARINENVFNMIKLSFLEVTEPKEIKRPLNVTQSAKNTEKVSDKIVVVAGNSIDIRINNCFVEANKSELANLSTIWNSLDKDKLADIDLSEYKPVAASIKYAIYTVEEESLADLFNIKSETIEKLLKKNNVDIKVVAISELRWQDEKEKYKKNIINKMKYEYIEEPQDKNSNLEIEGKINELFTDKPVEIA